MKEWLKLFLNAIVILAGIIVIALIFRTVVGGTGGPRITINFVPIVFAALAFASLREALRANSAKKALGGLLGFVWLLVIAACGIFGFSGIFITLGIIASIFLGTFSRPITNFLLNRKASSNVSGNTEQITVYYQQSRQSSEEMYRGYEQGYQPAQSVEERETRKSSPLANQYEQPQAQYPQQMPPQQ